jgi:hypothetical protein
MPRNNDFSFCHATLQRRAVVVRASDSAGIEFLVL